MWRHKLLFCVLAFGLSSLSLLPCVNAQGRVKTCVGVNVRSVTEKFQIMRGMGMDPKPETINVVSNGPDGEVTVVAFGPLLGSMDSDDVKTELACTQNGIALTATITRSANFRGGVLSNVSWLPRIRIVLALRQPEIAVQAIWRMRLTTGAEQTHAWSPPYPDRKYPIVVTEKVRSASGAAEDGQDSPLKVEIKVEKTVVKSKDKLLVPTALHNTSRDRQSLEVLLCCYSVQWESDNPSVHVVCAEACEKNVPFNIILKPGEAYRKAVPVLVDLAAGTGQSESVTFRLGFIGSMPKSPPIWSNAVTISVTK